MTVIAGPAPEAAPRTVSARARRLGIDTGQEAVAYFRGDSPVVHAEGFDCATRVWVRCGGREARRSPPATPYRMRRTPSMSPR